MTQSITSVLISVSDKTGVADFAQGLVKLGITVLSTGGTAKHLRDNAIPVTDIADYTGFPEMMDGRVKTLHPKIHAGILARADQDDAVMREHNIPYIGLVVVNLYPFEATIAAPDCTYEKAIANIDIGGPTMVRAAAKNHERVTIIVDHTDYSPVLNELKAQNNTTTANTRARLMQKAFAHTAQYDAMIANYLTAQNSETPPDCFPRTFTAQFHKKADLRYGENPHQNAAFYVAPHATGASLATAESLQGKPLSFNNIADADAALACVRGLTTQPACVIVKHANPCGVAEAPDLTEAYQRAFSTDSTSAFGGIIAFNQPLDEKTAHAIIQQQFVEVIIAPDILPAAQEALRKKSNLRVLRTGDLKDSAQQPPQIEFKSVTGGVLIQDVDTAILAPESLHHVTTRTPTDSELNDLLFAWHVVKFVKSNAIVYVKDRATVGIGAGQMSRVISAKIANIKAQDASKTVAGSVMASDAFFPFRDGIDAAAEAGIRAIIQPGGSIRDEEVIAAANEAGIAMVFTGVRHFKH